MDIYDVIPSRDVAEFCRSINKTWNTFEMAHCQGNHLHYRVSQSRFVLLYEKTVDVPLTPH
jgi:hypothetical protein